jgi:peptidoglycan/xylan/chitin deacetylase (PgdA/CDA1 family)
VSEPGRPAEGGNPLDLRAGLPRAPQATALEPVPVFCWHQIAPGPLPSPIRVSPATFRRQVQALAGAGAGPLSLEDYDACRGLRTPGSGACLLVFDDGYTGVRDHALPVLGELGWTAAVFPVLDFLGRRPGWDPARWLGNHAHLDREGLERLLDHGWQVGLHGRSHRPLDRCDLAVLDRELVEARAELELLLGILVRVISWPWGLSDRRARRLAEAAGLHLGLGRFGSEDPMDRPRSMVYSSHGPQHLEAMLAGRPPDLLQHLAALGAGLSAELARYRRG